MPIPYRPPMDQEWSSDREGMGQGMLKMAAEANRYYVGESIAENAPQAIPGLYIGQALQDVAKLGYFHGPKPVKSLAKKLSALAFGEDEQFNDKTTSRPSLGQYRGLHEGIRRGLDTRLSNGLIEMMAPRIAKSQSADPQQVRDVMREDRDFAQDSQQLSLRDRLEDLLRPSRNLRQARADQTKLDKAGLTKPMEQTPDGDTWHLTHPRESRKLLVDQLRYLNPGIKLKNVVPSNLQLK